MKEKEEVKPQEPQEPQAQGMIVPPEMAAQIREQLEDQAEAKALTEEIKMLLKSRGYIIVVNINIDGLNGLQPGWRVVKLK